MSGVAINNQAAWAKGWALDLRPLVRRMAATALIVVAATTPLAVGLSAATPGQAGPDQPNAVAIADTQPEILDAAVVVRGE